MILHHLRNATFILESGTHVILVDPMLGPQGSLPPFSFLRAPARRNPLAPLPHGAQALLGRVTLCLITHSQTFGLRALQHTDHLDATGEAFLREREIPVVCPEKDADYLAKLGLRVRDALPFWQAARMPEGSVTAVPARHGHGFIHKAMANGAGFHLALPDEPSLYVSGDTVLTPDVERALRELRPGVAVAAAGGARMDLGGPILMPMEEVLSFVEMAPGVAVLNHLEALNHCPVSRAGLRQALAQRGLSAKALVPADGESLRFGQDAS